MAYITTEEIAKKRKEIKKAFPNWKFSITRLHYSTIRVSILEADIKLTDEQNTPINHFYIKDHYKDNAEVRDSLQTIADILLKGNEIVSEDSDYGNIPNYYVRLSVGEWDKPFIFKPKV